MARKKSKAQLEAELRLLRKSRFTEGTVQVLLSLIRWGAIILVARYGYLSIEVLSGKNTLADIGINFLSNIKISVAFSWFVGVGGAVYGLSQRKLRRDTVERLQGRIQMLEKELDPARTSSRLTKRGDTRPEDKL
ncbi:MAG TPA: hypothetical protein ENJ28_09180 [Gammaproteobacteria bacterium]|nr:hypothetical protein [Gammaproteobacteria bacterium]